MDILNKVNVLVADKTTEPALELLNTLKLPEAQITFFDSATQAVKSVKNNKYDLIILGDRLKGGDTFDVGLEIKNGKNKKTAVACVGYHIGRTERILNLIGPTAIKATGESKDLAVDKLLSYLAIKEKESQG